MRSLHLVVRGRSSFPAALYFKTTQVSSSSCRIKKHENERDMLERRQNKLCQPGKKIFERDVQVVEQGWDSDSD